MIYYVGNTDNTTYPSHDFSSFIKAMDLYREHSINTMGISPGNIEVELDTETNIANIDERVLILIQFGITNPSTGENDQWLLQWSHLSEEEKEKVKVLLESPDFLFLSHNVMFEYTTLMKYGIMLDNVYDTMLVEQILHTGKSLEKGFYSLAGIVRRYFNLDMSKEQQDKFEDNIITDEKIEYAALDVSVMRGIKSKQMLRVTSESLDRVVQLENKAVLAFGDISFNGMDVDTEMWMDNYYEAFPLVEKAKKDLDNYLINDPQLYTYCVSHGYIVTEDTVTINWNSPKQKTELLGTLMPHIKGFTKPVLMSIVKKNNLGEDHFITRLLNKDFDFCNKWLMNYAKDVVERLGYLEKEGTVKVNWASPVQRLEIFKVKIPGLSSTSKEVIEDYMGEEIIQLYEKFNFFNGLVTKFGKKWLEENLNSDGKVRTKFNQVLATGRVSSSGPNMQQIPGNAMPKGQVNKYRNCFVPPHKDWYFVSSDYVSQELVVTAYLSNDPVWLEALSLGKDLHSVTAELVYKDKWKDAAEEDCSFYEMNDKGDYLKVKCKCPGHKSLRDSIKTINFGLIYGMSANALSNNLKIPLKSAESLINQYFRTFPKIHGLLETFARFGKRNGYITTAKPFNRKRYFENWEEAKALNDRGRSFLMGSIERQSMNTPMQGTSGDMTKLALVLMRKWINENNMRDVIKIVMQVHDQIDSVCHKSVAVYWSHKMTEIMEQAAKYIIPTGIMKAETDVTERWSKEGQGIDLSVLQQTN